MPEGRGQGGTGGEERAPLRGTSSADSDADNVVQFVVDDHACGSVDIGERTTMMKTSARMDGCVGVRACACVCERACRCMCACVGGCLCAGAWVGVGVWEVSVEACVCVCAGGRSGWV